MREIVVGRFTHDDAASVEEDHHERGGRRRRLSAKPSYREPLCCCCAVVVNLAAAHQPLVCCDSSRVARQQEDCCWLLPPACRLLASSCSPSGGGGLAGPIVVMLTHQICPPSSRRSSSVSCGDPPGSAGRNEKNTEFHKHDTKHKSGAGLRALSRSAPHSSLAHGARLPPLPRRRVAVENEEAVLVRCRADLQDESSGSSASDRDRHDMPTDGYSRELRPFVEDWQHHAMLTEMHTSR